MISPGKFPGRSVTRSTAVRPWRRWLLVGLVVAAFALRLYRLDYQDIWWDEARNIDVASRPLAQIATAGELDIHPPAYFYLLHGWLALTGSDSAPTGRDAFGTRFLSLWFGVLLTALMYALGRRVGGFSTGLGAAVAAACLPFLLGEAQEARMYTLSLSWLAAAGLAVLRAGGGSQKSNRHWLWFALFSALALLTHYASVFALVALWSWAGLWVLAGRRDGLVQRLRVVLLAGLATVLLCLPGLPVALRQIPSYRNPNLVVPSAGSYLAELARVYGLGEHIDAAAAQPWSWGLAGLLTIGWVLAAANARGARRLRPDTRSPESTARDVQPTTRDLLLVFLWALLPLVIYYVVIADRSTFATRYIAGALPSWLLLGGLAIAGWARLHRVAGGAAALALVATLAPGLMGDLRDARFFREDMRGMAAWLRQETNPARDLILVDQRYPFGLYWPRWNGGAGGVPPAEPSDLAPAQYLFVDINTVADRLSTLIRGRERVYLVRWFESDTDPRGAAAWVLQKFGTRLGTRSFRGYEVTWYATPPEADFELALELDGPSADFGDQVQLAGYAFGGRGEGLTSSVAETRAPLAPADQPIWVVARWSRLTGAVEPGRSLPRGLKATVVLEDANGFVVGSDDRVILNDRHLAPLEWSAADRPLGVYLVVAAPGTPPGAYTVKLAAYDPLTWSQLPASGPAAQGSFVTLGQVRLNRPTRVPDIEQLPIETRLALAWRGLRLLGRGSLPAQVSPGSLLTFDLFWQAEQSSRPDLRARFELRPAPGTSADDPVAVWEAEIGGGYAPRTWIAGDVVRDRLAWRVTPDVPAGSYRLAVALVEAGDQQAMPETDLGQITVAGRAHVFGLPANMGQAIDARFGDVAKLLGFDVMPPDSSGVLSVILYWQAEGPSERPYSVSAQLLDAGGILRAQRDQVPGNGAFPTTGWVAGEVLTDAYQVHLPPGNAEPSYTLIVKMYDAATGETLPVTLADGTDVGDFLRLAETQGP